MSIHFLASERNYTLQKSIHIVVPIQTVADDFVGEIVLAMWRSKEKWNDLQSDYCYEYSRATFEHMLLALQLCPYNMSIILPLNDAEKIRLTFDADEANFQLWSTI